MDLSGIRGQGIALVGYRGTGKSTVGRLLAARTGWAFVDADAALEARLGCTIAELFATRGEPAFRDEEEITLRDLTTRRNLVLATGGGAVIRPENRHALRRFGAVVWLQADPAVIASRLTTDSAARRPALTARGTLGEIAAVLAAREPFYRELADLVVATDGRGPEQVADAVLAAFSPRCEGGGPE